MLGALATSSPVWLPSTTHRNPIPGITFPAITRPNPSPFLQKTRALRFLSTFHQHCNQSSKTHFFLPRASAVSSSSSVGSPGYTEEPATTVRFQNILSSPGCSTPLSLLGIGYREKVFAIIGVKVYAAGLYVNPSILSKLDSWRGSSAQVIRKESSLFDSIFQAPLEKSLQIVLVRDIDGKTFWDALDEAISPRIKSPAPSDEVTLSTFRSIFQGRPLKKGTFIFLTWLDPEKMLVSVSSEGVPSAADATIESANVTSALFDVFLGNSPVSPSLKTSVANGLETMLK